jgi:hypothetical protein
MKFKELTIYTGKLQDQINFYNKNLQLHLIKETSDSAEFKIGDSHLKLIYKAGATPYHFAINIPRHSETKALEWLKRRVSILIHNNSAIVDFPSWNAKSIYFYDNDKNIVELISRNNINPQNDEAFDENQFLNISEIGMAVPDIEKTYFEINNIKETEIFDGDFNDFCAAGDESGLFIIINKYKKHWFPTNDKGFSSDFKVSGDINAEFTDGHLYPAC